MQEKKCKLTPYNLFPDDHKYLTFLKKVFRHEFRKNWFKRLSTTLFREKDFYEQIFKEKINDYVFTINILDSGEFSFKPSPSIASLKAYIDWDLYEKIQPVYHYYMDRFYPKKLQKVEWIWLFWADVIWEDDPIIDAQMIFIVYSILNKIWLGDIFEIRINSLWNKKEQLKYIEELKNFYTNKLHLLSDYWKEVFETNTLSLLTLDNEDEKILAINAPKITKYLKKDSKNHYESLKSYLNLLNIWYIEDPKLIWEYDFINNTIWEVRLKEDGYILSSWFRYNTLSTLIWQDKEIPASWFSVDAFKLIDLLKQKNIHIKNKDKLQLYFVQLWEEAKKIVFPISLKAREAWINTAVSLWTPSMKEQILKANKSWANYVVLVWFMEAKTWVFQVRDLEEWTQTEVKKEDLIEYIIEKIWKDKLDFYEPSKDLLKK